jgi:hypothetical protein
MRLFITKFQTEGLIANENAPKKLPGHSAI